MKKILLTFVLLFMFMNAYSESNKELFDVKYEVLSESSLLEKFPVLAEQQKKAKDSNIVYAVGYISMSEKAKGNYMVELEFYNPEKRAFKSKEKIGWITSGRFFAIYLGYPNDFSKLDYRINILMQK